MIDKYYNKIDELSNNIILKDNGGEESEIDYLLKMAKILGINNLLNPSEEKKESYLKLIEILIQMKSVNRSNLDIDNIISFLLKNIICDLKNGDSDFLNTDKLIEMIKENPLYLSKFIVDYIYYSECYEDMTFEICEKNNISLETLKNIYMPVLLSKILEVLTLIKITDIDSFAEEYKNVYCHGFAEEKIIDLGYNL